MGTNVLHKASDRFEVRSDRGSAYFSFSFGDRYREDRLGFGALRVINDDFIFPAKGFGSHPHDNMEIISIVQAGALTHRDSLRGEGAATPHRLQIISAGTGIFHSEFNEDPAENCRMLQIWLYPDRLNITPRYQQADYAYPSPPGNWQLLIEPLAEKGADQAHPSVGQIRQQAWFHLGNLPSETRLPYAMKMAGHGLYVFVIEGSVSVEGQKLESRDGLGVTGVAEVEFVALSPAELLLIEVPMTNLLSSL